MHWVAITGGILAAWIILSVPAGVLAGRLLAASRAPARDDLMDLADATRERIAGCDCTFWNNDTDSYDWVPCEMHIDQLIAEILA